MKRLTLSATVIVAGFGASHADAQAFKGTDVLEFVTINIIANCPAATGVTYLGGGSGIAENAMAATPPTQQIAPMTRKIKCALADVNPGSQGQVLGYDGVAMLTSSCSGEAAGSLCEAYSAASALGSYVWQGGTDSGVYPIACDKLRVLYFGRDHFNTDLAPGAPQHATSGCNSLLRNQLVNSWGKLFDGAQSPTCTQLNHAFRLDDVSGTTDTLRSVCGIPASFTFCNGTSTQDNDPIRRTASSASYDTARADGTLGLVLPVTVPRSTNTYSPGAPAADSCGAGGIASQAGTRCTAGVFIFGAVPGLGACPTGLPRLGGTCLIPAFRATATSTPDARCVNASSNKPAGSAPVSDGRTFNLFAHNADGSLITGFTSGYYRTHESRAVVGSGCKQTDTVQQLACLVRADQCSEGFAGREALNEPNILDVKLAPRAANGATPSSDCLAPEPASIAAGTYPLSRKLYLNTLKGFANVTGEEADLVACFQDEALVEAAMSANNFIPDPAVGIQTENFSAANCF
ncbi:MAG: hypothetical protein RLZZ450_6424 [Pseudomonadota bacterium]|jgi:hypothetical protein